MKCKICGGDSVKIFDTRVLYKYNVSYYQCKSCDFIQTENPYWLEEAYISSMNLSDTGVMLRSERMSKITTSLICLFLDRKGTFLDYAGGLGVFTRTMRDIGFDYYWDDPFTKNEVARGFEGSLERRYDMITTFESFEHFNEPLSDLEKMLQLTDTIILTTDLVPPAVDKNWWYIAAEHGQHIAFHTRKSFRAMAKNNNLHYYNAKNVHILTRKKLNFAGALFFKFRYAKELLYLGYYLFAPFIKSKSIEDMNSFYVKDKQA
jgi:hypothetical protein